MLTLDQYITQRFANDTLKKIYVSQEEFDTLKAWIKANNSDYTTYYGRYEQGKQRNKNWKGSRNFYIASNRIVVEFSRLNFRGWDFYENIVNVYYLFKYEIVVQ